MSADLLAAIVTLGILLFLLLWMPLLEAASRMVAALRRRSRRPLLREEADASLSS